MQDDKILEQILRRLDILIALQLEQHGADETASIAGKIRLLVKLGLTSAEVASIVGKPSRYVAAIISQEKKASGKGGKKNE